MSDVVDNCAQLFNDDKVHFFLAADENVGTLFEETLKHWPLNRI